MEYGIITSKGNMSMLVRWQDGQSRDTAPEVVAGFPEYENETLELVMKLLNYNETPPPPIPE